MKITVEKKKKEFQKTIDKSQNLMYNKYVRLRKKILNAYRWGSSCDLATARYDRSERAAKYSQTFRTGQRSQTTPVWWNGIHSRLKICRLTLMGSNPITGTKFSCVYKVEFGTMRQDGCTLDRERNCMREGCNTAKAG